VSEPTGGADGPFAPQDAEPVAPQPEQDWVYIVSMMPTVQNKADFDARRFGDQPLSCWFDDPVEATAHAMREAWWPFVVERFPRG